MVTVGIKVKNASKAIKPSKGDVIIYDGKDWYVTTKEDLLKDAYKLIEDCKIELEEAKDFRKEVAAQMKTMSDIIQVLYKHSEDK